MTRSKKLVVGMICAKLSEMRSADLMEVNGSVPPDPRGITKSRTVELYSRGAKNEKAIARIAPSAATRSITRVLRRIISHALEFDITANPTSN